MAIKATNKSSKTTKKSAKAGTPKFSKETYIKWYKDMLLIRKFEEKNRSIIYSTEIWWFLPFIYWSRSYCSWYCKCL